ncbi:MAG: CDP-glycerol glycerophosphotransferase family protein [Methanobacterium sp.]|nr:CDP-glycerol glycerophosphotransferase family protein [Methanobacterium sp.]
MNIRQIIKKIFMLFYYIFRNILPLNDNVIFFESSVGRNYSSNPKYVYEEMVMQGLDKEFKCVWSLEDMATKIPGNAIKVRRTRLKYLYYISIAKIWVCDTRLPTFLYKRPETIYIQLWHGTPLKKLAMDMDVLKMSEGMELSEYQRLFKKNTQTWDYLISQSNYTTETFRSCFDFKKQILNTGFPRNDILFKKNNKEFINSIKNRYNIPKEKKVILYAPTWRDDEFYRNGIYKFSTKLDLNFLKKQLSNTYVLLVKLHYLVKDPIDWNEDDGFVYIFDHLYDIQELYLISDMLITDYSSVMFDYSILKRPMIIYSYDYEKYKNQLRGFYFNIFEEFPGPIVETTPELVDSIKNYDCNKYQKEYISFLEKFTSFDDGNASSRIVDLILQRNSKISRQNKNEIYEGELDHE